MANMWAQMGEREQCQRYLRRVMRLLWNGNEAKSKSFMDCIASMVTAYEAHRSCPADMAVGSGVAEELLVEWSVSAPMRPAALVAGIDRVRALTCDAFKENTLALVTWYATERLIPSFKWVP